MRLESVRLISDRLSEEALLEQVCEECGELVQASSKRLRILRGENPTPISRQGNLENVFEEMLDVRLCIEVLIFHYGQGSIDSALKEDAKLDRWIKRLGMRVQKK